MFSLVGVGSSPRAATVIVACAAALGMVVAGGCSVACRRQAADDRGESLPRDQEGPTPAPLELLVASDPETLDPRFATGAVALRVTRLVHAGLFRLDDTTMEPLPDVAEAYRWDDDEKMRLRVRLRPGVRFHSGRPLTSADVVATLRALASPVLNARHARAVEAIARVDADGDDTVVVTLARPHATLLTDLEVPILRADQAENAANADGTLDGLGPFRIASIRRGEVRLEPSPPSSDGTRRATPARRGVVVRTVRDENARAMRLLGGRTDVTVGTVSPGTLSALDGADGLRVVARRGASTTYLLFRLDTGPFKSLEARRAVALSIDREELSATLFAGRALAARGMLPPHHWLSMPAPPARFDPRGACDAWASREKGEAASPTVTLLTSTERLRVSVARLLAQGLRPCGVDIDVVPLELGTLLARVTAGEFELAILQIPELTEPNILRVFFHGSMAPPAGANRGRLADAVLDALLDEGAAERDPLARRAVYARVEDRLRELVAVVPLVHEDQVAVVGPRARGFVPTTEGRWSSLATLPP